MVKVSATIDGRVQTYSDQVFRLKRIPDPIAKVKDMSGGSITRNDLAAQVGVGAVLEDFLFDYQFVVQRFSVSSTVNTFTEKEVSTSYRFTQAQKDLISKVPKNGRVFIEDIFALGDDGEERDLPAIVFIIQ